MRKTKIIATIGPASSSLESITSLARAGMNVARLNFSHGDHDSHKQAIRNIRSAEMIIKRPIAILGDLAGPKIRTGKFGTNRQLNLKKGEEIVFAPEHKAVKNEIPVTFPELARDVKPNDTLLLDDGKLSVKVIKVKGERIIARVVSGGILKEHKGINLPGISVRTSAITDKDVKDLLFAIKMGVDFIGISFVQCKEDIERARKIMKKAGKMLPIVAKIERETALHNIDEVMTEADAIMIARGDLGVETPLEMVPIQQKNIISLAHAKRKSVIVATQMLESMIESDRPTRAEVSDVANSVFDGADVVMLSAETASGKDPVNALKTMAKIVSTAEHSKYIPHGTFELDDGDDTVAVSTARAACFAAEEVRARTICVFTMTGRSALYISKQRPDVPILAMTGSDDVSRRMSLCFGTTAVKIPKWRGIESMIESGIDNLLNLKMVEKDDRVVIVCGTTTTPGATNMIKILTI